MSPAHEPETKAPTPPEAPVERGTSEGAEDAHGASRRFVRKSRTLAYAILGLDLACYATTLILALVLDPWPLATLASLANGVCIGMLFVVAHDACHGSYLPTRLENYLVGQLAFLPALHPFSLWDLSHNRTHHRYTNLATHDYVYRPLSLDEYRALPSWRRAIYRFHRSLPGHLTYYLIEIWKRRLFFPRPSRVGRYRAEFWRDHAAILLWLVAAAVAVFAVFKPPLEAALLGFVVPFLFFTFLVSFAVYLHHTHPAIRWYASEEEWDYRSAQKDCTVHVRLPDGYDFVFHRIMEHNAHHMRPGIPLYRLVEAQDTMASNVVELLWSPRRHLWLTRVCRLYDYDNHRWLDYSGEPTG